MALLRVRSCHLLLLLEPARTDRATVQHRANVVVLLPRSRSLLLKSTQMRYRLMIQSKATTLLLLLGLGLHEIGFVGLLLLLLLLLKVGQRR